MDQTAAKQRQQLGEEAGRRVTTVAARVRRLQSHLGDLYRVKERFARRGGQAARKHLPRHPGQQTRERDGSPQSSSELTMKMGTI